MWLQFGVATQRRWAPTHQSPSKTTEQAAAAILKSKTMYRNLAGLLPASTRKSFPPENELRMVPLETFVDGAAVWIAGFVPELLPHYQFPRADPWCRWSPRQPGGHCGHFTFYPPGGHRRCWLDCRPDCCQLMVRPKMEGAPGTMHPRLWREVTLLAFGVRYAPGVTLSHVLSGARWECDDGQLEIRSGKLIKTDIHRLLERKVNSRWKKRRFKSVVWLTDSIWMSFFIFESGNRRLFHYDVQFEW